MSLNNNQDNEKIKLIKELMSEKISKPHESSFDLFQRILFHVQLHLEVSFERCDPAIRPNSEELHEYAIIALDEAMSMDLFNKYTDASTQEIFKQANKLYHEWESKFNIQCFQAEILRRHKAELQN